MSYTPTAKSYFSGGGLLDWALASTGILIRQSLELDVNCCDTLRNISRIIGTDHQVLQCDIREQTVSSQPESDVIIGTYPCTKYSAIADIHGTRTGDDLFLHFFRHVAIKKPEAYVVENVPGMKKFPVVMEAMTKLPDYYVNVFCPVKTHEFLPQKRNRLILIGTRKNFIVRPPYGTYRVPLRDIIESCPDVELPQYVLDRLNGKYRDLPIISDPERGDIAPTCVAHYSKDRSTRMVKDKTHPLGVRPYTVREYGRLMGMPDSFIDLLAGSDSEKYKQIGNGVPIPIGQWIGSELMRYFN